MLSVEFDGVRSRAARLSRWRMTAQRTMCALSLGSERAPTRAPICDTSCDGESKQSLSSHYKIARA